MSSELKTNKISPATGTTTILGDASDVFQLPASAEIDIASGATLDVNGTLDVTGATVSGLTTGSIVKISSTAVTSSVSSIDFAACFSATYETYLVTFVSIGNASSSSMYARFGNSDLSTTRTHGSQYHINYANNSNATETYTSSTNGFVIAPYANTGNILASSGQFWVYDAYDSSVATKVTGMWQGYSDNHATYVGGYIGGQVTAASQDESIQFHMLSGNIGNASITGRITIYGVAH